MIARMARWALWFEMLLYGALAVWMQSRGHDALRIFALAVAIASLLRFVITIGPFLTVLALRVRDGKPLPASFIMAIIGEYVAKSRSFTLWQPFESWLMPADPAPVAAGPAPILLVHGYLCNRGSWLGMQRLLQARLPNPVHTISLEPAFTRIDDYVPQLEAKVAALLAATGHSRVHLVCHSMGGLVARAWLVRSDGWRRTASLTTLGSPHHGTELARFGLGHNVRQMVHGNAWLSALQKEEKSGPRRVPVMSVHTENDNLVYPPESADLPWAANIRIEGVGHVQLQSSVKAAELVAANIGKAALQ
ncbi:MAG: alpha/beta fold hydrolase [Betaproteobacteria bacterium]|nr:alpha/beta fold hydrolase [Betaproteobacteria bacterium]